MKQKILAGVLFVAFFVPTLSVLAQESVVYDDHGRRDPFWPLVSVSGAILSYDDNLQFNDMVLEGVIYDPQGEKLAIINSRIIKASDMIGGFSVVAVNPDSVVLSKQGQEFTLNLKKE